MDNHRTCEGASHGACELAGPPTLEEALHRFDREAVRGVCDTGRYRCAYYVWGTGPPLLFIPGLSGDARSFILLTAHLAGSFRCIAYDLPSGGDGARLDRLTHADLVADVFALLDHVQARQSYVYGTSFGSTIALAALLAQPERLLRGVLQGGFARRSLAPAEVLLARLARRWRVPMHRVPFYAPFVRRLHQGPFASSSPAVWEYFLHRCGSAIVAAVAHRALLMHQLDLRPQLPAVRSPVLLVCGDDDPLVNRTCEQELLQGLPHAGRMELSRCGHYPRFTHPEVLAEVVRRFLKPAGVGGACG